MPSLFSRIKTWVSLEKLTASDLNAEFNNILNNLDADQVGGSSGTVGNMQTTEDPGEVGSESLASSIEGEIRRLRNVVKEITGKAQWYETPDRSLDSASQYNATTLINTDTDPDLTDIDIVFFDTSSGAIDLTGIQGGASEQIVYLVTKDTTNSVTVRHNGAGTQKIKLEGGQDKVLPAAFQGGLILTYDGTEWVETGTGIADNEVTESKILNAAVTTDKINDGDVTAAKLATGVLKELKFKDYTASGADTFTPPSDVTSVIVLGVGGGGGGGAGSDGNTIDHGGGGGGAGSAPALAAISVTPSTPVSVFVGGGGAAGIASTSAGGPGGNGSDGSDSFFDTIFFGGAAGGQGAPGASAGTGGSGKAASGVDRADSIFSNGGDGGAGGATVGNAGQATRYALGGAAGTGVASGGGPGGGGGAGIGAGADGATYVGNPNGNGTTAASAAANTGAGGGGGTGNAGTGLTNSAGNGGAGGSGFLRVFYVSAFNA